MYSYYYLILSWVELSQVFFFFFSYFTLLNCAICTCHCLHMSMDNAPKANYTILFACAVSSVCVSFSFTTPKYIYLHEIWAQTKVSCLSFSNGKGKKDCGNHEILDKVGSFNVYTKINEQTCRRRSNRFIDRKLVFRKQLGLFSIDYNRVNLALVWHPEKRLIWATDLFYVYVSFCRGVGYRL